MTINIFQVPEGTNINLGCGCGTGGGNGGSIGGGDTPQLPPGGTAGGDYTDRARVIDICRNVKTIFQDPIQDWIDTAQNRGYLPGLGEDIVSTFPIVNSDLIDSVQESLMEIQAELYGDNWTSAFKKWIVTYFDDPFPGFGGGFASYQGRIELINLAAYKAPLLVAGAPFWPAIVVWALTADIAALNQRIKSSAGTASYTGECAQLQKEAGREPYRPPAADEDVIVIEDENYKYTRVLNDSLSEGADQDYTVAGENFVALLVRWRVYGGSGQVGTASLHSLTITHADGTSDAGDSTGSGSVPITNRGVSGVENFGATAAAAVPSYLSDFSDVTSAKEPSGATFPVAGAFTGTFSAETRFTYSADYQVWIVTDLDGSAEAVEA